MPTIYLHTNVEANETIFIPIRNGYLFDFEMFLLIHNLRSHLYVWVVVCWFLLILIRFISYLFLNLNQQAAQVLYLIFLLIFFAKILNGNDKRWFSGDEHFEKLKDFQSKYSISVNSFMIYYSNSIKICTKNIEQKKHTATSIHS